MAKRIKKDITTDVYEHKDAEALLRPDVGLQAQFKKKKPPVTYRYDKSLDPELSWDINKNREYAEGLIRKIYEAGSLDEVRTYAAELANMSKPFLNWAGKAENNEVTIPTLPLFVHERLSTRAILESVKRHKQNKQIELFADVDLDITDRILKAYEHKAPWVNRMILGDSLVVMNSLLQYEGLGGQVQMIYIDPPYGVKFGSNFQPFIRKRDVKHNKDEDFTREPEMVQAYRDTWELGIHSYLTYLRDRFLLSRELLHPSGSIFVQISDENLHLVRCLLDEVFGAENFVSVIPFRKKTMPLGAKYIDSMNDYILWYGRNVEILKFYQLFEEYNPEGKSRWMWYETVEGMRKSMISEEFYNNKLLPKGSRIYRLVSLRAPGYSKENDFEIEIGGRKYRPPKGGSWITGKEGMERLIEANRLQVEGDNVSYILYNDDFPLSKITNFWTDTTGPQKRNYVVETDTLPIQRCLLMTTDPGDLVLDPTCGSGTTAYVAEQWGRRWITIDTSRVPLALARQRLLTATFPYYELRDEQTGVAGGFKYERKQNSKGEEVGGIVPHITLKSIAQGLPPKEEILVDRPNEVSKIVRVSGPFVVEATIPTPMEVEDVEGEIPLEHEEHISRMIEVLKRSPIIRLTGNQTIEFRKVRRPTRAMELHCEAEIGSEDSPKQVAFIFGPENGAVSEQQVFASAKEAYAKSFSHLYVIGFAVQDAATKLIQNCEQAVGIPATYVSATMDIQMQDLLKTTRASQVFSVTGSGDVRLIRMKDNLYQVELLGLDVFDPTTMEVAHRRGDDVPAWFLDTDYNELTFRVSQAFFPRTGAWDNIRRALKGVYEDSVWEHLAGTASEPFPAGSHNRIAVKVIDDRGNELMVVKSLDEAEVKE